MTEHGVIVKVKDDYATVRIGRNSACASCGKCGMTENQKYVDFFTQNSVNANVGDVVEIDIPEKSAVGIVLVGYALPLVPALVALFVALGKGVSEFWSIMLFFAGYFAGVAVVAIIDAIKKHQWGKSPVITKIISGENNENKNC